MAARNDDFRAAIRVLDCNHIGPDSVPYIIVFGRDPFAHGHDCLKLTEIHDHVRSIESPHSAADDFTRPIFELIEDHFLLDLADPLQDGLAGGLRSDSSESFRRHHHFDHIAHGGIGFGLSGARQRNLVMNIPDYVRNDQIS